MNRYFLPLFFTLLSFINLTSQSIEKEFLVNQTYLNLPVSQDDDRETMTVTYEDGTMREFVIRISDKEPDYWVFINLKEFQGQKLKIHNPTHRSGQLFRRVNFLKIDQVCSLLHAGIR